MEPLAWAVPPAAIQGSSPHLSWGGVTLPPKLVSGLVGAAVREGGF